jgi:hypothetical protein
VAFRGDGFSSRVLKVPAPSLTPESPDLEEPDAKEVPKRKLVLTPNPAAAAADDAVRTSGPGSSSAAAAAAAATDEEELPDWGDKAEEDSTFVGACGATREAPLEFKCDDCHTQYYWHYWVAPFTQDNAFAKVNQNYDKLKAIRQAQDGDFKNQFTNEKIRTTCAYCAEKLHKRVYVDPEKKEPNNYWRNKLKEAKGYSRGKKALQRTLGFADEKAERAAVLGDRKPQSAKVVYQSLRDNHTLRLAVDWVVELCNICYLWYACAACGMIPVRSNMWWRLVRLAVEFREGLESASSDTGHWHCGNCLTQWNWTSDGGKRVFAFGRLEDESQPVLWGYIGDTQGTKLESKIQALKACTMLEVLDGKEVTREHLLEAIEQLNCRAVKKLVHALGSKRTVWLEAKDPTGVHNHKPFVSDERLMLKYPGTKYLAIDLGKVQANTKDKVQTFSTEELEELLDTCAGCMDLSSAKTQGPAQRKALNHIEWYSEAFKRSRTAIREVLASKM